MLRKLTCYTAILSILLIAGCGGGSSGGDGSTKGHILHHESVTSPPERTGH